MALLAVSGLSVNYQSQGKVLRAVEDVSFDLGAGDILGIVGESGSGKSTVGRALMRILPKNGSVVKGSIVFDGVDLMGMTEAALRAMRWNRVAMVFQGSGKVLDPVYRIGDQIAEAIRVHRPATTKRAAWSRAQQLIKDVGISPRRVGSYPHELSGGMKQRVNIAMAMALEPDLIIADEPTTALDVISQDNVMETLNSLQREHGTAMILISHDMGLIAENCSRVAVMYAGRLVEIGGVLEVFDDSAHPYTMGLINAIPKVERAERLVALPGSPPSGPDRPGGCLFQPRCPFGDARCSTEPPWIEVAEQHGSLCHFAMDHENLRALAKDQDIWDKKAFQSRT
jgi:oligopeptide/dipeptide ABC transporter ATP-binding protein